MINATAVVVFAFYSLATFLYACGCCMREVLRAPIPDLADLSDKIGQWTGLIVIALLAITWVLTGCVLFLALSGVGAVSYSAGYIASVVEFGR